ncbi:uncharacterized protein LOC125608139 [Brassica napus]|uniref:uncharacterized protein LOC125608139 n=1 Tax=Brassica napus TaxID=3708 RepID=UPI00207904FC|nr:uncharacterized protein LOC125608139 [Brassica napus]
MFKKKHLAYLVSKAARVFRVCDFYTYFHKIKMVDLGCADYLTRVGFEHWTRSHSHGMRYNVMTSNVAESLNPALSEAREREAAASCGGLVTPKVEELIFKNFDVSTGFVVRHINKAEYEVKGMDCVTFIVNLEQKNCSCLEFDMLLIPCVHASAAAIHSNRRVDSLVGEKYTRNICAARYSMSINPKGSYKAHAPEPDTLGSLQLAPPKTRHPPRRPKKSRILSKGEFKFTRGGGLGRKVRTCRRCGGTDHNRATCKMPI